MSAKTTRPIGRTTVVLVSADAEWRAVRRVVPEVPVERCAYGEWFEGAGRLADTLFLHGGWGKIAAAATAQFAIERWSPGAVINLGTCGGFKGRVARGSVVLVERAIVYDIHDRMGDPAACVAHYTTDLDLTWLSEPYPHPVVRSTILSADRDLDPGEIADLQERYGAIVGDWESGSIAWVARRHGLRTLILRVVKDLVDPDGGEAYDGSGTVFEASAARAMAHLVTQLPDWIDRLREGTPG